MHEPTNRIFDVKELSNYIGIAQITVYCLGRKGKLPAKKVGRVWRFKQEEID